MWNKRQRLDADLARWRDAGWVTAEGHERISQELASRRRGVTLASALAILAVVLLAFAVLSFVAAHWAEMPRLMRLALLFALVAAGYVAAGKFEQRNASAFADAAVVFASAMFGTSIMLISQMFHIDGNPPDAVGLWAMGTLLAGAVLASRPTLAFAMALVSLWGIMETGERETIWWPFLLAWGAVAGAFALYRWAPGFHLAAIPIAVFVVSAGFLPPLYPGHALVVIVAALTAGAGVALSRFGSVFADRSLDVASYALAVGFAALFAMQFIEKTSTGQLIIVAVVTLIVLLAAISYGLMEHHRGLIWVGYLGFAVEIFALYWKTLGGLLGNALFFLLSGVLVAAFAAVAWRLSARDGSHEVAP